MTRDNNHNTDKKFHLTGEGSPVPVVNRRTCIKLAATAVTSAGLAGASPVSARADSGGFGTDGYGTGAFGGASTGGGLTVETAPATNVTDTTATFEGDVTDLGGASTVTVSFEYRPSGANSWTATPADTRSTTGSFSATTTDLQPETTYEFRAVAEASDGDTDVGTTRAATTDAASGAPAIDRFAVSEAGKPNPHARISVEWRVSDADGDLQRVSVEIRESDGQFVDSAARPAAGTTASDTDSFRVKHGGGTTYAVDLHVFDETGNGTTRSTTVNA